VGWIALVALLLGIVVVVVLTRPRSEGPTYSTPNGEFPNERTYLNDQ